MANNIAKVDLIQKTLDEAMIQGAVTGFMEANAGPVKYSGGDEIKAAADYVTTGVDEDGLYHAFAHLGLI